MFLCTYYFTSYIVPIPNVIITTLSSEILHQSLTIQCKVTTVRGITSRVDIVWSSGGTVLKRINGTTAIVMGNSLLYTHSYTITQLCTNDDGRVIQCEAVINVSPLVIATDSITLTPTGEC